MNINKDLSSRIKLLVKHFNITQKQLAQVAQVSPAAVNLWISGKIDKIKFTNAFNIAKEYNISLKWLVTGEGSMREGEIITVNEDGFIDDKNYVQIPEYMIHFAGGVGHEPDYEELTEYVPATYRLSWFQERGINPKNCKRFTVEGHSMEPLLYPGDKITVDMNDTTVKSGHVYALIINEGLSVKRLFSRTNGDLIVRSENPDVPDDSIKANDITTYIKIIGRVIDASGSGGL